MRDFVNTPVGPVLQRIADAFIGMAVWLFISMTLASKPKTVFGMDDAAWLCAPLLFAALCIRHNTDKKLDHPHSNPDDHAALGLCIAGIVMGFAMPWDRSPLLFAFFSASSALAHYFAKFSKHWGLDNIAQALLWKACRGNQPGKALQALALGACPVSANARGTSALEHCCQSGYADLAALLLHATDQSTTHALVIENAMASAMDSKLTALACQLQTRLPDAWTPPNNRRWRQTIESVRWRDPSWLQSWLAQVHARNEKAKISLEVIAHDSTLSTPRHRKSL
jgi:hypothetical protein